MSFCPNCGNNAGESNFCPSCGTAIKTEAAKQAPAAPQLNNNGFSPYYPELQQYAGRATQLLIFGILSIVFCLGIGLIFEIIAIIISAKIGKPFAHADELTNPVEIAMYNKARSQHKIGAILSSVALIITGVLLFATLMLLLIGMQL